MVQDEKPVGIGGLYQAPLERFAYCPNKKGKGNILYGWNYIETHTGQRLALMIVHVADLPSSRVRLRSCCFVTAAPLFASCAAASVRLPSQNKNSRLSPGGFPTSALCFTAMRSGRSF
jgi:hypothetical protein